MKTYSLYRSRENYATADQLIKIVISEVLCMSNSVKIQYTLRTTSNFHNSDEKGNGTN